ncbi:MAG TPA: hypothetical protein DHW45_04385 [Candidatus Latescibacteria bacterium]|jgi:hypothetical protein|nr:hypothetical protein [Candidatus Latescibacterota bacterium]
MTNSDGLPAMDLTEEQKWLFDTKGWLAVPEALSAEDVEEMREFAYQLAKDPESIPEEQRSSVGGPLQRLTDHPLVVGFMTEFVGYEPLQTKDGYGFRHEGSFLTIRPWGPGNKEFRPHGGRGVFNFPGNHHTYHVSPGKVNSGLTRVVFELNEIRKGDGGTLLLTGSHKAAFDRPASTNLEDSPLWDTYSCPAGTALIFTEALTHAGVPWKSTERERCAVFNCYNTIGSKWHQWEPPEEVYATMPAKRQSLYRPTWCDRNRVNPGHQVHPGNAYVPEEQDLA